MIHVKPPFWHIVSLALWPTFALCPALAVSVRELALRPALAVYVWEQK